MNMEFAYIMLYDQDAIHHTKANGYMITIDEKQYQLVSNSLQ